MIISTDSWKALDKVQHPLMDESFEEIRNRRKILQHKDHIWQTSLSLSLCVCLYYLHMCWKLVSLERISGEERKISWGRQEKYDNEIHIVRKQMWRRNPGREGTSCRVSTVAASGERDSWEQSIRTHTYKEPSVKPSTLYYYLNN